MKCPYCGATQGRCATTPWGRSITECGACGRVMEERQTQSHHLFHMRAQDTPLCLSTSDLPTPPPPETDAEKDEDPFEQSGFITAFSTWSLEHCPLHALSSFSFSGHLAELERALDAASSSSSNTAGNGVVVDNLRAYLQIVDVASILGLEHYISHHAFQLFRDCSSATCLRNRSVEALATACLVQAIREAQEPRTLQEISIAANLPQKEIGKYIKILGEALQLSQPINSNSISVHMPRFCNLLQLNKSAQELATHIGEVVMNKCFCTRRNPISISAAAIYLACQLEDRRKTQAEICKVTGLTEVTLRKVYKELLENWDDLLPSNYTPVVPPEKAFPTTTLPTGRSSMARVDPSELVPLDRDRNPETKGNRLNKDDGESKSNSSVRMSGESQSFQGIRIKKFHSTTQDGDTKLNRDLMKTVMKWPPSTSGSSSIVHPQGQGQLNTSVLMEFQDSPSELVHLDRDRNPESKANRPSKDDGEGKSNSVRMSGESQGSQGIRIKKFHSTTQDGDAKLNRDLMKAAVKWSGSSSNVHPQGQGQLNTSMVMEFQDSGNKNT